MAAGYPIGSGGMESTNKLLVEARLKGAGMHWTRAHVNALLEPRTIRANQRWTECWPAIWTTLRTRPARSRPAPSASPIPPHSKTIVNGKPTADHPWRRDSPFPAKA